MTKTELPVTNPVLVGDELLQLMAAVEEQPTLAAHLGNIGLFSGLRSCTELKGFPTTFPIPVSQMLKSSPQLTPSKGSKAPSLNPKTRSTSSVFLSFWDYHEKYLSGQLTPTQVAYRVLKSIQESQQNGWLRPVDKDDILRQATASTERYQQKKHKSQLDGVFMVFKEDQDIQGHVSFCGTSFLNKNNPAKADSTPIARLRDAGVIIVGHATMNEIGWDTFSVNPNSGTPLNPYNLKSSSGGSSGGSAAAVCGGIVPISLGGDGGGSVRIPASFCGLYSLKPTAGRVSGYGGAGFAPSVGVVGPIATTADDLALAFSIISGPDEKDPKTLLQPPFSLDNYEKTDSLEGITIAIVPEWNQEVKIPAMTDQLLEYVDHYKKLGAKVVEINIDHADLIRAAHSLTISAEMCTFTKRFPENQKDFLPYTRILMSITKESTAEDYIKAQQVRTLAMQQMEDIFEKVDLIVSPVTAIQALDFPDGCFEHGLMDGANTRHCTQFCNIVNFTGIPAVAVPSGYHNKKPVGIQLMAGWYQESLLLRMAKISEHILSRQERQKPEVSYSSNHLS